MTNYIDHTKLPRELLYATRTEAIDMGIIQPIERDGDAPITKYDIGAIANELIAANAVGGTEGATVGQRSPYYIDADEQRFWQVVNDHREDFTANRCIESDETLEETALGQDFSATAPGAPQWMETATVKRNGEDVATIPVSTPEFVQPADDAVDKALGDDKHIVWDDDGGANKEVEGAPARVMKPEDRPVEDRQQAPSRDDRWDAAEMADLEVTDVDSDGEDAGPDGPFPTDERTQNGVVIHNVPHEVVQNDLVDKISELNRQTDIPNDGK